MNPPESQPGLQVGNPRATRENRENPLVQGRIVESQLQARCPVEAVGEAVPDVVQRSERTARENGVVSRTRFLDLITDVVR